MTDISTGHHHESGRYEIRLKGHLDPRWAAWFDGMSLINESDGISVIRGPVIDQAARHGLLQKLATEPAAGFGHSGRTRLPCCTPDDSSIQEREQT
jgi:hypothetical protein